VLLEPLPGPAAAAPTVLVGAGMPGSVGWPGMIRDARALALLLGDSVRAFRLPGAAPLAVVDLAGAQAVLDRDRMVVLGTSAAGADAEVAMILRCLELR
jgi:hypothetical protein